MRTLPERSEFRGSGREAETREERLRSGSIHRARFGSERGQPKKCINQHRKLSTASSPCSYRVWTPEEEEEVDHYGYVLAGSPAIPERGESTAQKMKECSVSGRVCVVVFFYKWLLNNLCFFLPQSSSAQLAEFCTLSATKGKITSLQPG